jgi:PKD repeat protein
MGDGTTLYGSIVSHQYTSSGTYTVYLHVTDNSDNIGSTSQNITIDDNESPTASFVYSPTSPVINEPVYFNAAQSTDPDGSISSYQWNFGDGNNVSSQENQVEHTYDTSGTYTVVLVVTDDSENTGSVSKTLTVTDNSTPIASFVFSPTSPSAGDEVTFDASPSKDPDGGVLTYFWSFGDSGATSTDMIAKHTYNDVGTYNVSLTVEDEDGNTATTTQAVTVN